MRVPPPHVPAVNNGNGKATALAPEPDYDAPLKSGAKPDDTLTVSLIGGQRIPSPNPSLLSVEDASLPRQGAGYFGSRRRSSRSPHPPPRTLKEKAHAFWTANLGLLLVLASQFFGTLMNVATRMLEVEGNEGKGYHPFQILFARMGITVVCSSWYMWYTKTTDFPLGAKEVRGLLVARGLMGFFGVFGMYYSLLYLPLADATVITFLAPSLACWACSYLIAEPFTRMEQIAAYVSLFGVFLIARPVTLFASLQSSATPSSTNTTSTSVPTPTSTTADPIVPLAPAYADVTPAQRTAAVGIALLGVIGSAGAYTTIRWIGKRAHPLISVNYFATWCTIVSTVMMFALPDVGFLLPQSARDFGYLIFLGVCGFVMQFLLAAGLQHEKSSRATNMVYVQMLFALAFDKLFFGTTPSALSIVGSSLILGSAVYVATHKTGTEETKGREEGPADVEEGAGLIQGMEGDREVEREGYGDDNEIQLRTLR